MKKESGSSGLLLALNRDVKRLAKRYIDEATENGALADDALLNWARHRAEQQVGFPAFIAAYIVGLESDVCDADPTSPPLSDVYVLELAESEIENEH